MAQELSGSAELMAASTFIWHNLHIEREYIGRKISSFVPKVCGTVVILVLLITVVCKRRKKILG